MIVSYKATDECYHSQNSRKAISLNKKVEILDRLARGEPAASVGRLYDINESTIRTIKE